MLCNLAGSCSRSLGTLAFLFLCSVAYAADTATTPCKRTLPVPEGGSDVFVESTATSDNVNVAAVIVWDEDCDLSNGFGGKAGGRNAKGKQKKVQVRLSLLPSSGCVYVFVNGTQKVGPVQISSLAPC